MRETTYKLIGKFIADKNNAKLVFTTGGTPHANMKNNTMYLPLNVKDEHRYYALTVLLHEAAHLRMTTQIPHEKLADTKARHTALNIMEDVRINKANMDMLPHVREMYNKTYTDLKAKGTWDKDKCDADRRASIWAMINSENMYIDVDLEGVDQDKMIQGANAIQEGCQHLNNGRWKKAKDCLDMIVQSFNIKGENDPPPTEAGPTQSGEGDDPVGMKELMEELGGEPGEGTDEVEEFLDVPAVVYNDKTKALFKEFLSIKGKKQVEDGLDLDVDNLTAFPLGEIEELFKEDTVVKKKKSKVVLMLDASGSMNAPVLGSQLSAKELLATTVKGLTELLDEIQMTEGTNVAYEVHGFACTARQFNQDDWENEYARLSGGTDLKSAYELGVKRLNDPDIDGNRILLIFTDGQVCDSEVQHISNSLMRLSDDVRCLILGINARPNCEMLEKFGDFNILLEQNADEVLLDALTQTLS